MSGDMDGQGGIFAGLGKRTKLITKDFKEGRRKLDGVDRQKTGEKGGLSNRLKRTAVSLKRFSWDKDP